MQSNEEVPRAAASSALPPPRATLKSTLHMPPLGVDCPAFERTLRLQSLLATVVLSLSNGEADWDCNERCHLRDVVRFLYEEAEAIGEEIEEMNERLNP